MSKVFLSHATADRKFVEQEIIPLFKRHVIGYWYSRANVQTAAEWQRSIVKGLEECDWFLVVMTRRAVQSRWVKAETLWAFDHRPEGRIIPILLDDCDRWGLHIQIPLLQYIDYRKDRAAARQQLLEALGYDGDGLPLIGETPTATAVAAPASVTLKQATKREPVVGKRPRVPNRRIGQVLVDLGFLDDDQLWEVLAEARATGQRTGQVAVNLGLITESQLHVTLGELFGLPVAELDDVEPDPAALARVPQSMAAFHEILPLSFADSILTVAMSDPANLAAFDELRNLLSVAEVMAVLAPGPAIQQAIERVYTA